MRRALTLAFLFLGQALSHPTIASAQELREIIRRSGPLGAVSLEADAPALKSGPVARPKSNVRAIPGTERDDPLARLNAQREDRGIPSIGSLENLRQQRRAQRSRSDGPVAGSPLGASTGPAWVPIGPTGADYEQNGISYFQRDSGRARRILPHPTDPNTVYFLTSGGGLWVSRDFTAAPAHWAPLTDFLSTTSGGSVAFGRTPSVLYLGTGDPFDVVNVGGAMVKSIDGGATWSAEFDLGNSASVRDVGVDTSGPTDTVLVATDFGLYRSTDGGSTYVLTASGSGQAFEAKAMWNIVRTSAGWLASAQPCTFKPAAACATAGQLYISTDIGATWNPISNLGGVYAGAGRTSLAVAVPGDAVVYAYAENAASTDQLDLFRSSNGGLDWTRLNINAKVATNANSDAPNLDLMNDQSWYNQMVVVDPRDAARNTVYIGGDLASAKSADGGNTWTILTDWLLNAFCTGPVCAPLPYAHADFQTGTISLAGGGATLMFGNDGGLAVSTDDGATWSSDKNNGLQTHLFYSLVSTPSFPNAVLGGTQDNGTRVRKGNTSIFNQSAGGDAIGTGWSQANAFAAISSLPNNVLITNLANQVPELRENWIRTVPPLVNDAVFYTPLSTPAASADPSGKVFFTSSQKQVYRTGDGGLTWSVIGRVGTTIPSSSLSLRSGPHAVEVSPVDLSHVGVIGAAGEAHFTADGGTTWSNRPLNTLLPGFQSFTKSITWANNQTIYVTSVASTPGAIRVAKSIDGGTSWARADTGLPDVPVNRILVDRSDPTNATLVAATDVGVFRSTNAGASWQAYGSGLPSVSVTDLYMPPDGGFLRIATYGRGLWQLPALSYVSATLTDDGLACDRDGVLDNGETGNLAITLRNDGAQALNAITATISSTNPKVTFPSGNGVSFPSALPGATTTASVLVALNSAVGVQQIDFAISYNDTSLGLAESTTASFRANYDEVPSATGNDTEARTPAWTVTGTPAAPPDALNWQRREIGPLEHRWVEVDSMTATDVALVSPALNVGSGTFTLAFEQRYRFAATTTPVPTWFDGMVLEATNNGGASWVDIGTNASPGYDHVIANGNGNVLEGRSAYAGSSTGYPAFLPVSVNLGTQFAGQQVKLRFRVATNTFGSGPGVELRNIVVSGIANTPFTSVIADRGICSVAPAITSANSATFTVNAPGTFTVTATGSPTPALSMTGSLPSGVTFAPGSGALAGTPALGTVGSYPVAIKASNGVLPDASQSFTLVVQKANQAIDFTNPGAQDFLATPLALVASATSGLAVTLNSLTTLVCTVSGNNVTMVTAGTCTSNATQAGNGNYNAAAPVPQSFDIRAVAPGAPAIGAAIAGDGQASIAFTQPTFNGGSTISGYLVNCLPGPITASGPASPITVSPLANGTAYSCSVKAVNTAGPGASSGSVSVTPQPATYPLSVSRSGNGSGTVTSAPPGVACGSTCAFGFAPGILVTLSAVPSADSSFSSWGGDCTGSGTCQVTMSAARNVTATFTLRTSPEPFTFIDQVNVQPNTVVTSNTVTITGMGTAGNVTVTGGSYAIGCTGTFTTAAGSIANGQTVCVRHITPLALTATTNTTLTIGTTSDTFSSTTASALDPALDADNDGIPNAVETIEGRNPLVKDNDVFGNARLFAMQQYRDFLGREGDAGGITAWTNYINGGGTRAAVTEGFFGSNEFQGTGSPVVRLYFAYFLRIPDYGGLTFWMNYFRTGHSLVEISNAFAGSQEFVDRYGALTNSAFVDLVYQNVLGRPADAGGKAFWLGQLNGGMSRGEMMTGFSESAEYQSTIFSETYVTMMYVGMLKRQPDQGGFTFWVGYLDQGNSGQALINGFLLAPEYRNRFLP